MIPAKPDPEPALPVGRPVTAPINSGAVTPHGAGAAAAMAQPPRSRPTGRGAALLEMCGYVGLVA